LWKLAYEYDLVEIYGGRTNLGHSYAYKHRLARTLELVASVASPGARVLDVAASQGNFSLALAEMGFEVTWNDLNARLVDYVRLKHESGTIAYAPGNIFELTFPQLFDVVVITEVIEHVAHPDRFLAHAATLVKPGGYVVMTTPNGKYFNNKLPKFSACADPSVYEAIQFKPDANGHIFLLHPDEIPPLAAQAALQIEALSMFNNPMSAGQLKSGPALRALPPAFVDGAERLSRRLPPPLAERLLVQMSVLFKKPFEAAAAPTSS